MERFNQTLREIESATYFDTKYEGRVGHLHTSPGPALRQGHDAGLALPQVKARAGALEQPTLTNASNESLKCQFIAELIRLHFPLPNRSGEGSHTSRFHHQGLIVE